MTPSAPYIMCSPQECDERVRTGEVSVLELTSSSAERYQPRLDPCKAVSKYRRSAAGSFTDTPRPPPRSLTALRITVHYLIRNILMDRSQQLQSKGSFSFLQRVNFVEDRVRAVQVDLVRTEATSKELQCFLARSQILILYLLADCPTYERKFGATALQSALASYWHGTAASDDVELLETDGEILSLTVLVQLNYQLRSDFESGGTTSATSSNDSVPLLWFALTELYRKFVRVAEPQHLNCPLFQWTLHFVSECCLGHWQTALSMILKQNSTNDTTKNDNSPEKPDNKFQRFLTLARCCLAPSVHYIRWKVLQAFNVSLLKNEAVSGSEMARILCFQCAHTLTKSTWDNNNDHMAHPSAMAAADMALEMGRGFGLPVVDRNIRFKVAPIQPISTCRRCDIRDDRAVFGESISTQLSSDGIAIPPADWMERIILASR